MSEQPPQVTTLEGMGILLWHLQQQIASMERHQAIQIQAVQTDVQRVQADIQRLASVEYVDKRFDGLAQEIDKLRPMTIIRNVAAVLGLVIVVGAVVALAFEAMRSYDGRHPVVSK